jgi:hypothetical protein
MNSSSPEPNQNPQKQKEDDSSRERYQQLALFSFIVAEIALLPLGLGGLVYFFLHDLKWGLVGGGVGLLLGSYRVYLLLRRYSQKAGSEKGNNDGSP